MQNKFIFYGFGNSRGDFMAREKSQAENGLKELRKERGRTTTEIRKRQAKMFLDNDKSVIKRSEVRKEHLKTKKESQQEKLTNRTELASERGSAALNEAKKAGLAAVKTVVEPIVKVGEATLNGAKALSDHVRSSFSKDEEISRQLLQSKANNLDKAKKNLGEVISSPVKNALNTVGRTLNTGKEMAKGTGHIVARETVRANKGLTSRGIAREEKRQEFRQEQLERRQGALSELRSKKNELNQEIGEARQVVREERKEAKIVRQQERKQARQERKLGQRTPSPEAKIEQAARMNCNIGEDGKVRKNTPNKGRGLNRAQTF